MKYLTENAPRVWFWGGAVSLVLLRYSYHVFHAHDLPIIEGTIGAIWGTCGFLYLGWEYDKFTKELAIAAMAIACATWFSDAAFGATQRSPIERRAFIRSNPCPATAKPPGPCPGYVVDHIKPLCAGGADRPGNMQWQTVAEAKEKDKWERKLCSRR